MKNVIENLFGFLYTLSMGDYIFFVLTFAIIIAFIYVLYLLTRESSIKTDNEDLTYLESIKKELENNYKPEYSNITEYEKEQEENAIISYDELINTKNNYNYSEEYISNNDDILVKKVNIDTKNSSKEENKIDVKLLDYSEYEDFLTALKQLQNNLLN